MKVFNEKDIKGLKAYKYSGIDQSLVSIYFLNPYWWSNLVKLFPLWFAPNLITLSGFGFIIINLLTLLFMEPNLENPLPNWVYLTFALGLFCYQSFDAIDGKQARRTGTSGPLGELFDHGVDALNTSIGVILTASAVNFSQGWMMYIMTVSALSNFYLTTWEENHTGTLFLSFFSGPVEGLLSIVGVFTISGIYSPLFWENELFGVVKLNTILTIFGISMIFFNLHTSGKNVIAAKKARNEADTIPHAFLGLIPFVVFCLALALWLYVSPSINTHHHVILVLISGAVFGHNVGQMILNHVCKRNQFPYFSPVFATVFSIGISSSWLIGKYAPSFEAAVEYERILTLGLLTLSLFLYFRFALSVIHELCEIFDMNCLTIKQKKTTKTQ